MVIIHFLMTNKYPLAVLIIHLDPVLLDVNVHPQKLEVKFMNESIIKYHVEIFIKEKIKFYDSSNCTKSYYF